MTKRNLQRLVLLIGLGLVGFILLAWWSTPRFRVDHDSFQRIQLGMTVSEIAEILGGSPNGQWHGQHLASLRKVRRVGNISVVGGDGVVKSWQEWIGNGAGIVIGFDDDGRACQSVHFHFEESFLETFRRRLQLNGQFK